MRIAGSGNYDLDEAISTLKENNYPNKEIKIKKPFLKRGQGKNCLKKNSIPKSKNSNPINTKISKKENIQKNQNKKQNMERKQTNKIQKISKTVITKPSQTKLTNKRQNNKKNNLTRKIHEENYFIDQEPENSFDVSIQNEKQVFINPHARAA